MSAPEPLVALYLAEEVQIRIPLSEFVLIAPSVDGRPGVSASPAWVRWEGGSPAGNGGWSGGTPCIVGQEVDTVGSVKEAAARLANLPVGAFWFRWDCFSVRTEEDTP